MSELEKNRGTEQPALGEKKPYRKPAFEYEEVFETMALACIRAYLGGRVCMKNHSAS